MEEKQAVIFRVSDEYYAIEITEIQEIIEMKEICQVPNSKRDYLKGVINIRGIIIPVISLSQKIGKEQANYTKNTFILNVITKNGFIGIIVDELINIEKLKCETMPKTIEERLQNTCSNIAYLNEKIIPIIDLKKILDEEGVANDR